MLTKTDRSLKSVKHVFEGFADYNYLLHLQMFRVICNIHIETEKVINVKSCGYCIYVKQLQILPFACIVYGIFLSN